MSPPPKEGGKKRGSSPLLKARAEAQRSEEFVEAMRRLGGVTPLTGAVRLVNRPNRVAAAAAQARRDAATGLGRQDAGAGVDVESGPGLEALSRAGERFAFVADGVDKATLKALEAGDRVPEASLDLHGFTAPEAEARLHALVRGAQQGGRRVLHVIHGRGLGSREAGPVLRTVVLSALTRPPLATLLLAVVAAPPRWGGAGATFILLRRRRG